MNIIIKQKRMYGNKAKERATRKENLVTVSVRIEMQTSSFGSFVEFKHTNARTHTHTHAQREKDRLADGQKSQRKCLEIYKKKKKTKKRANPATTNYDNF